MRVARAQVRHEHRTIADLITGVDELGYWGVVNAEDIEEPEYEVIGEDER